MSSHIDSAQIGETTSITYLDCCYHFRRQGTGWYLSCVDHLDTDTSTRGELVRPPNPVIRAMKRQGKSVIR